MKQAKAVDALPAWRDTADSNHESVCIVREWEVIEVEIDHDITKCLYGTIVSDYRGRFENGDYVFTSAIKDIDFDTGLVRTKNSLYCLQGGGEILSASLIEAYKMKKIGQSLHLVRAIENDLGQIIVPDD
ncbi:DUF6957 family protein [Halomonas rhizosphaerae]|uniref:DUF6957 domain-containing protein n=1 Tax=Halomonas rhizosphaerae TaxID=3043296 RepID=A0ABT6V0M0_9GAMM|nr:hypothetical protein [Halomonas rhizosphaerae]MDI5891781.1 hypothetical protein [Halomonas rhizosphaerae]